MTEAAASGTGDRPSGKRREWRGKQARHEARLRSRRRVNGLLRFAFAVVRPLPLAVARTLFGFGGLLVWAVSRRIRRRAVKQLERALGDRVPGGSASRVVRRMFVQHARSAAEVLVVRRLGAERFEREFVTWEGREHLEAVTAAGKGGLIVTGHFGNWELLAAVTRLHIDLKVVGKTAREEDPTHLIQDLRSEFGVETISQTNARALLRAIRKGGIVGLLPDQDVDRIDGIFLPFFGRPAYTPTGPASMAAATGAPLIPIFFRREGGGRHRAVVHAPIHPDADAPDREAEVERLTRAWTAIFEEEIGARPDLWVWFHRRWRTTPERLERVRERRARKQARRTARAAAKPD